MNTRSAQKLKQAMEAYFARCDDTRERSPQKGGGFLERQIPYTIYGLSQAVDMGPRELLLAARGQGVGAKQGQVLLQGVIRIAAYVQERALLGELNATMAQGVLKELNLLEAPEEGQESLRVVLDEAGEVWSR